MTKAQLRMTTEQAIQAYLQRGGQITKCATGAKTIRIKVQLIKKTLRSGIIATIGSYSLVKQTYRDPSEFAAKIRDVAGLKGNLTEVGTMRGGRMNIIFKLAGQPRHRYLVKVSKGA